MREELTVARFVANLLVMSSSILARAFVQSSFETRGLQLNLQSNQSLTPIDVLPDIGVSSPIVDVVLVGKDLLFITLPPKFGHDEYNSYVDFNLWDLEKVDLRKFDVDSALSRTSGFGAADEREWRFWKYVEEAEFGLGLPIHMVCGI
ncbi:hypothetical protein FEM48_Zijuj09G0148500 [Ziziphus jujuba var. spinosa]|uniref:Uncharacterized protein n=1 Tax=Ziziphus jujuba var. spinosa TaxID=714518 RepID=A0A978UTM1_ZIZJJ|nr:hypothetical protein FEM48_Zijuj09G0148500 [Ziziphus jujuba var. spinosa]